MKIDDSIEQKLRAHSDPVYREFQCRLMPTVDAGNVLGVRVPALRALAKELRGTREAENFLAALPHRYCDENNLHACLICGMKDCDSAIAALDAFLPFVDNWATCDTLAPAAFKKRPAQLWNKIELWLASSHSYTIRFGIGTLMRFYLDDGFAPEVLERVASLRSEEYYVNMMIAWFFATALAKQWDAALPYLTGRRLDRWCHNKTIQKAIESYRVTDEHKAYLRTLKY